MIDLLCAAQLSGEVFTGRGVGLLTYQQDRFTKNSLMRPGSVDDIAFYYAYQ